MGTLIFEWEAGAIEAKLLLEGKLLYHTKMRKDSYIPKDTLDGNKFYAKKLVEIAKEIGFDGYLMNFECKIDNTDILIEWLSFLREELHKEIPGSLLIWYDSVLHDG